MSIVKDGMHKYIQHHIFKKNHRDIYVCDNCKDTITWFKPHMNEVSRKNKMLMTNYSIYTIDELIESLDAHNVSLIKNFREKLPIVQHPFPRESKKKHK